MQWAQTDGHGIGFDWLSPHIAFPKYDLSRSAVFTDMLWLFILDLPSKGNLGSIPGPAGLTPLSFRDTGGVWNRKTLDQFDRLGPYDCCFGGMFGLGQVPEPRPADSAWRMIWNHRTGL